jgi:hypothetical protein
MDLISMTFKVTDLAEIVKNLLFNSKEEHEKGYSHSLTPTFMININNIRLVSFNSISLFLFSLNPIFVKENLTLI